jgi:hypothetical protein
LPHFALPVLALSLTRWFQFNAISFKDTEMFTRKYRSAEKTASVKETFALACLARVAAVASVLLIAAPVSAAEFVVFENLPTNLANPPIVSFHNARGPVVADDFVPIISGGMTTLTWWGSAAASNSWELVLQKNNPVLGQPALTPSLGDPTGVISGGPKITGITADSVPYPILPGVFQYTVDVSLMGFNVQAGTEYWLTIANFADGWNWAQALDGPVIGSESFNAHSSTGGICTDGGPHCGPWTDIHTDFAMRVSVPLPSSLALLSVALLGLVPMRRRKLS